MLYTNTLERYNLDGQNGRHSKVLLLMSGHYLLGYGLDHQLLDMLEELTSNSLLPIYNAQNGIFDMCVSYGLIGTIISIPCVVK